MSFVTLTIVRPVKGQVFVQPPREDLPIAFEGATKLSPLLCNVPMHYRWYSSLNTTVDHQKSHYALNVVALTTAEQVYHHPDLPMGSQVIALAASDQPAEAFIDSLHVGVAGGADQNGNGHIIHVLRANILEPGNSASRAGLRLQAEAPWAWEDKEYRCYNRLRYRWLLTPLGTAATPDGISRPTLEWTPDRTEMQFSEGTVNKLPRVTLEPSLPAEAIGSYMVRLFVYVEDADNPMTDRQATDAREILLT